MKKKNDSDTISFKIDDEFTMKFKSTGEEIKFIVKDNYLILYVFVNLKVFRN